VPDALRPAVFLDRDGVLNTDPVLYVMRPEQLTMLPGAAEAVARINAAGLPAVLITNQSGIEKGLMSHEDLADVHRLMEERLSEAGAALAAIHYCPHTREAGCTCRKPLPGMVLEASAALGLDPTRSYFVGDKPLDVQCGASAGCRTVFVLSGLHGRYDPTDFPVQPNYVCTDVTQAVDWILAQRPA
jgi:D-glycero-D-manno-heptose 1,7-bisphosphate phosphatase